MSRHYTNRGGAFNEAMRAARIAYWRRLQKAHPRGSLRHLAQTAGVSASTAMRFMREAGFQPVEDTRWVLRASPPAPTGDGR